MKNIRLKLEYDGTNYSGWQKQKNATTIQQTVEEAIYKATNEQIELIGVSRTDAKVHAKEYICNFTIDSKIPGKNFKKVINAKLPSDIVALDSEEVSLEFHSRFNNRGKTYIYTVLNTSSPIAIGRNYSYHFAHKLNVDNMSEAARYFIGTHDFSAFKSSGSDKKNCVRTITGLEVAREGDYIKFIVSGDGFLYNMVRIIVGTLLEVGIEKRKPHSIKNVIESKDRLKAGPCVPGHGLCLYRVFY
ncbi:tRNA pseudouridine(38-40) synthase TruA [Clostridium niameyense]|uniref:tRNA pseudouridine synthase A n=1 Tax=Clostridium niameyense TaxID=1622073 RepID=A0A6M0RAF9_9CLOT|nr:tRNA pseudouridine(38-40) synthase TruA [Clostridium niameyense]NEZ46650.1 tRNA pseudouridine(38-40) synthase TruA [Clostridium niameyense]